MSGEHPNESLLIRCVGVSCRRSLQRDRPSRVEAMDLDIVRGSITQLCGPEECGKVLLLHLLGLMERPDSGRLEFLGTDTATCPDEALAALRKDSCGYLFDSPCLLPSFSVAENLAMPLFKAHGVEPTQAGVLAAEMLEVVGLAGADREEAGGLPLAIQCRVALARALVHRPAVLFAEDPCRDLESAASDSFTALVFRTALQLGVTVVWASEVEIDGGPLVRRVYLRNGRRVQASTAVGSGEAPAS